MEIPTLALVWFLLIAVLWTGYFVLEGFDFGVGMLVRPLGRTDGERRLIINTIGPVWDGNEVWLIVAGASMFAAFPEWYATLFSGFYLPLLIILAALIIRGVSFEYRGTIDDAAWRNRWDWAITAGSWIPAVLWGVAFANLIRGVDLDADHEMVSGFFSLLSPFALLGGATTALLFATHGAIFLALKTDGDMRERTGALAARLTPITTVVAAIWAVWAQVAYSSHLLTWVAVGVAAAGLVAAIVFTARRMEGWAFAATSLVIVAVVVFIFGTLFPNVMPAHEAANSLTIANASSTPYTLKIMTWVAVALMPFVLGYQAWTYWVFRTRLRIEDIPAGGGLPLIEPTGLHPPMDTTPAETSPAGTSDR